jgi:hypothetical protein
MSTPKCDVHLRQNRCKREVYAEVFWNKGGWSYTCKKHFLKKRKQFKLFGVLDEWWIEDQFSIAIRKIENKFGICQSKSKTIQWCLAVEFNKKINTLSREIFHSIQKHQKIRY